MASLVRNMQHSSHERTADTLHEATATNAANRTANLQASSQCECTTMQLGSGLAGEHERALLVADGHTM